MRTCASGMGTDGLTGVKLHDVGIVRQARHGPSLAKAALTPDVAQDFVFYEPVGDVAI